ncbi:hypothetical protein [Hoeflea sp.]|uniref:hypothetical protein n=1 Tax=Hoeflea sp. TaxID=1940281 RepID=UPI0037483F3D
MSDSFRDLERPEAAHRKDAVLMAAISGLEYLDRPSRQDMARFSKLFLPLFETASLQTRRTAAAALSRLPRVPDDVAELLINQPIEIAAPFIAHFSGLKENALARAVALNGAPHARAAARRNDLSPQAIASLRALNDPSVEGLLVLRGLIPDPAKQAAPSVDTRTERLANAELRTVETPPLDPSEGLRDVLRALALRNPVPEAQPHKPGYKAPLNRPVSQRKKPAEKHGAGSGTQNRPASAATLRRLAEARLHQLARYAKPDHENWFATALADAMETSFALAERIMMDLSGRQLATALIGLKAPPETTKAALESFFPHLSKPSTVQTQANDLISNLDPQACAERLSAWQRADRYTSGGTLHVPALADGKPVRSQTSNRATGSEHRQDNRKAATPKHAEPRKAG